MSDDLQARLDALPEWPEPCSNAVRLGEISSDCSNCFDVAQETVTAALARLALAREWIEEAHQVGCLMFPDTEGNAGWKCDCGRDALLKKMEVPT